VDLNDSSENLTALEDPGVKGRFVAIEHLKEYEGGRIIEWRKILCGEFGGLIPRFCVRRSMPEKLAQVRSIYWLLSLFLSLSRQNNKMRNLQGCTTVSTMGRRARDGGGRGAR
jgi:hypothetical protein